VNKLYVNGELNEQENFLKRGLSLAIGKNILTEDVHPPILALCELDAGPPRPLAPVTLAGPSCDSVDVIARDYPMPPLAVGDIVVSPLMGAYTAVTSSRFNGITETPVVVSRR
jgi:ornithine decarboxylase